MRLDLTGPSVNPHWHVPGSIHSLIGEIYVARRIFDLWQPYLRRRLDEHHSHTYERGVATSLIIQAGLITERSLKSLIAQTQPKWEGTYEHDLWVLYSLLRTDDRIRIQTQFEHPTFATQWRRFSDPNDNIAENIIKIAKRNFTDWRYTLALHNGAQSDEQWGARAPAEGRSSRQFSEYLASTRRSRICRGFVSDR